MSWSAPTESLILAEFTPAEQSSIEAVQGSVDNLPGILALVVAEFRDAIRNGGYALDSDATTLPLGLHRDCVAVARWAWLISLPMLPDLQTEARKAANTRAEEKLLKIAAQTWGVEPPTPSSTSANPAGTWNSENKLLGRMHPVPTPGAQSTPASNVPPYANPDAPADNS